MRDLRAIRTWARITLAALAIACGSSDAPEPITSASAAGSGACESCCAREDVESVFADSATPDSLRGAVIECFPAVVGVHYYDEHPSEPGGELRVGPPEGMGQTSPLLWGDVLDDLLVEEAEALDNEEVVTWVDTLDGYRPPPEPCADVIELQPDGDWERTFTPGDEDPLNGMCDCAEYVAQTSFVLAASDGPKGQRAAPIPGIRGVLPGRNPGTGAYRRIAYPLGPKDRATLQLIQTWRDNNYTHASHLKTTRSGRWGRIKVVGLGRGPALMAALANVHGTVVQGAGEDGLLVVGWVSHLEHYGGMEAGQTVMKYALPARAPFDGRDFDPETFRGAFPLPGQRAFLPYGAIAAVPENYFSNHGAGGGPIDQVMGKSRRLRRTAGGVYVIELDYQDDNQPDTVEANRVVIATGSGRPRRFKQDVFEILATDHPGADAAELKNLENFVEGVTKTAENLFAWSFANYSDSFDERGRRRLPNRFANTTPFENFAKFYAGQDVLVVGGGPSGLMAIDHLHFVVPEAAAAPPDAVFTAPQLRPRKISFAHSGGAISDAEGAPLASLVGAGTGAGDEGQYRRTFNLMTARTVEELPDRLLSRVVPVAGPANRRRLRVTFTDGSTGTFDRIITAMGQDSDLVDVLLQDEARAKPIIAALRPLRAGNRADGEVVGLWDEQGLVIVGLGALRLSQALHGRFALPRFNTDEYRDARNAAEAYTTAVNARITRVRNSAAAHEGPRAANDGSIAVHSPMIQEAMRALEASGFFNVR